MIVTCDQSIQLWNHTHIKFVIDAPTPMIQESVKFKISKICYDSINKLFYCIGNSGQLYTYNIEKNKYDKLLINFQHSLHTHIAISSDGKVAISSKVANEKKDQIYHISVYSAPNFTLIGEHPGHGTREITSIIFTPDNSAILGGDICGKISCFGNLNNLSKKLTVSLLKGWSSHYGQVYGMSYGKENEIIILTSLNIWLYNTKSTTFSIISPSPLPKTISTIPYISYISKSETVLLAFSDSLFFIKRNDGNKIKSSNEEPIVIQKHGLITGLSVDNNSNTYAISIENEGVLLQRLDDSFAEYLLPDTENQIFYFLPQSFQLPNHLRSKVSNTFIDSTSKLNDSDLSEEEDLTEQLIYMSQESIGKKFSSGETKGSQNDKPRKTTKHSFPLDEGFTSESHDNTKQEQLQNKNKPQVKSPRRPDLQKKTSFKGLPSKSPYSQVPDLTPRNIKEEKEMQEKKIENENLINSIPFSDSFPNSQNTVKTNAYSSNNILVSHQQFKENDYLKSSENRSSRNELNDQVNTEDIEQLPSNQRQLASFLKTTIENSLEDFKEDIQHQMNTMFLDLLCRINKLDEKVKELEDKRI